jgi:EAL domain-containing protein (putative c-di-GMP-specific phosphodiesterase class I)
MHDLGLRIALDDFGTGYSSLSYLRSFPFDAIKIDRLFISEMGARDDCTAIVGAIVSLAEKLGMTTTAEGVETEEQLQLVRELGCTAVQGYLVGKPQPLHDAIEEFEWSTENMVQRRLDALLGLDNLSDSDERMRGTPTPGEFDKGW